MNEIDYNNIKIITGAIPKPFNYYGSTDNVPFVLSGLNCVGWENSLFKCQNDSQLRFGEVNKYHGDPDNELNVVNPNMAGVRCERKCKYTYCS